MMTPDSVANKRFDKAMGGYRADEVEAFLEQVAEEMRALQAQKEDLEKKVEVLAAKIEEYREDEDSLRSALIGAQKLGDSVIRDSKAKAENILLDAKVEAAKLVESAQRSVEIEQTALVQMKKEVSKFKNRMLTMYRQHLDLITNLPEYAEEMIANDNTAPAAEPAPVPEAAAAQPAPVEEPAPAAAEEEVVLDFSGMGENEKTQSVQPAQPTMSFSEIPTPSSESTSSKFGQLKFGEGFDVERDDGKKNSMFSRKKHR